MRVLGVILDLHRKLSLNNFSPWMPFFCRILSFLAAYRACVEIDFN
jgi:hypothetical protein